MKNDKQHRNKRKRERRTSRDIRRPSEYKNMTQEEIDENNKLIRELSIQEQIDRDMAEHESLDDFKKILKDNVKYEEVQVFKTPGVAPVKVRTYLSSKIEKNIRELDAWAREEKKVNEKAVLHKNIDVITDLCDVPDNDPYDRREAWVLYYRQNGLLGLLDLLKKLFEPAKKATEAVERFRKESEGTEPSGSMRDVAQDTD